MEHSLLQWYDVHFAASTFDGRFQIGYRKKQTTALMPLSTHDRLGLRDFLQQMYIRPEYDYYITANSVFGVKRNLDSLFSYHNIVIDVDYHVETRGEWDDTYFLSEEFIFRFFRDKPVQIPKPTSIVHTGRGLQLWWSIIPVHKSCKPYFDEVRSHFIEEIQKILDEYTILDGFSVDRGASCNDVGYYRLPHSVNTKVGKMATVEISSDKPTFVLQDLVVKVKELVPSTKTTRSRDLQFTSDFADHEVFILKNVQTLAFFRMRQLILLRKTRNSAVSMETRNNLNFLMYNTLLPAMGEEAAWQRLLVFNDGFKEPMTEEELGGVIVSAKEKGGYKYSNKKIISFLEISPEEQEKIGLFESKIDSSMRFSRNPSRNASRALVRQSRNDKVFKLWNSGMNIGEIATELGLSAPTVSKILNFTEKKEEKKAKAVELLESGMGLTAISREVNLSISTLRRIKSSTKV